jgi:hypothetical protein
MRSGQSIGISVLSTTTRSDRLGSFPRGKGRVPVHGDQGPPPPPEVGGNVPVHTGMERPLPIAISRLPVLVAEGDPPISRYRDEAQARSGAR